MLVHALNMPTDWFGPAPFSDVAKKHWASTVIGEVAQAGYVGGFPDGTYHSEEGITRAQALVILAKTLPEPKGNEEAKLHRYEDADSVPAWAEPGVAKVAASRIIVDFPDASLVRPNDTATRFDENHSVRGIARLAGFSLAKIQLPCLPNQVFAKTVMRLRAN